MTEEELQHMKQTLHDLCGTVLRLQIDTQKKASLRDQFAMAAMAGLLADNTKDMYINDCAESAYKYADAMMEKRK
jgi:hypothetical protein